LGNRSWAELCLAAILLCPAAGRAATASHELLLWPEGAPDALGDRAHDKPSLTPYLPAGVAASGAAMVICPGGGYGGLADHEGGTYALFLNRAGITCFVLKYRLGSHRYRHPTMLNDAARALRWVRAHADEYGVDSKRVGIMGSSAGGHLASTLLTHFDPGDPRDPDPVNRQSSRPDLGVLCYPVITMENFGHAGSRENLLGKSPTQDLIDFLSSEKQVTNQTPPTFLWHTFKDNVVPVRNSLEFASALDRHGVPFYLHIYQEGGHGMGLGTSDKDFKGAHPWAQDLLYWLKAQGFLEVKKS